MTIRFTIHPILAVLALPLGACSSTIDSDWRRIDDLESRLGTIQPLESLGDAMQTSVVPPSTSDEEAVTRVEGLLELMSAGMPRDLTLAEVRKSTIEHNLQIQSTLLSPEIAAQRLRAEQAKFQATFLASIEQSRVVSPEFGLGPTIDISSDQFTAVPGLEVPLRSGGSVVLDWTLSTTSLSGPGADADAAASLPGVSLQQPLLRGAGLDYNEGSIVIAGADLGVARAEAQAAVINQVVRADVAYWNLHLAWELLQINLQLYETAKDLLDQQRRLVAVQAGSIANVYNFETVVANAVDQVIQAELGVRRAVRAVKVVMQEPSMTLDGSEALRPVSEPILVGFDFDARRLVEAALVNRAELLQFEFEQLARTVEANIRKNETLPQLDLLASWNAAGFDRSLNLASATGDLFDGGAAGWSVGALFSLPIGNEIALANYQAAILLRLQTVADRRQQEILVTQEVLDAIDAIEAGWNAVLTAELQVRAATRFYESYETLFQRGQIPSSNLTQALQALNVSKSQKATIQVEYQIALAQLAAAAGCLLGHASVDWTGDLELDRLEAPGRSVLEGIRGGEANSLEDSRPNLQQILDSTNRTEDPPERSGDAALEPAGAEAEPGAPQAP